MKIQSIKLNNFRNLKPLVLEPSQGFNVFSGNNGEGKTNLLEAIYSVCTLRSFRTSRLRDLIALGQEQAYICAQVQKSDLLRKYELTIHPRSKIVRLDEKAMRPASKYFGNFNVVLFAPEDLLIAKASPSERRKFLDRAVFTLYSGYLAQAQAYEKVLKNRNLTLKNEELQSGQKEELLSVYDEQISVLGAQILLQRISYLKRIKPIFESIFESITRCGIPVGLRYSSSVGKDLSGLDQSHLQEKVLIALRQSRHADLARGSTNMGPHRDVLEFSLAEQSAPTFASQGQLRAMILAWKISEMQLLIKIQEDTPILLLDDVSSELDPQKNEYLFQFLKTQPCQSFITTTHPKYILLESDRRDYQVKDGQIS